jgi:hypothetical protein
LKNSQADKLITILIRGVSIFSGRNKKDKTITNAIVIPLRNLVLSIIK